MRRRHRALLVRRGGLPVADAAGRLDRGLHVPGLPAQGGRRSRGAAMRIIAMPFKCNQPAVPTVQQDDANVRITRWDFAPGAATGYHTHGWPYFVVMLTDAVMKIEAADGAVGEVRLAAGPVVPASCGDRARRDERFGGADGVRRDRDQAPGSAGATGLTQPRSAQGPRSAAARELLPRPSYNLNQFA